MASKKNMWAAPEPFKEAELAWVSMESSSIIPDGPIARLLMETQEYWTKRIEYELLHPCFLKVKPKRYMVRSKPKPHEFGRADAKAVMRRVYSGKPVSPALVQRAVKTLVDDAYDDCW